MDNVKKMPTMIKQNIQLMTTFFPAIQRNITNMIRYTIVLLSCYKDHSVLSCSFLDAGDINTPASAQANKTFLPWETHLFTRLLKYGKHFILLEKWRNRTIEGIERSACQSITYPIF